MKNSIEAIWQAGFLNEKSLVAPKINDLYNRKSQHLVDRMHRRFSVNLRIILIMSIVIFVVYYFIDAVWLGGAASVLILLVAVYGKWQMRDLSTLDHGANSLDYLKSFDRWLKDIFSRSERIARVYYTLCFVIAIMAIGLAWSKSEKLISDTQRKFPDLVFIGDYPLVALIVAAVATLLMFYFSDRIYKCDVRLMYGGVFDKLEETITEMENLKRE